MRQLFSSNAAALIMVCVVGLISHTRAGAQETAEFKGVAIQNLEHYKLISPSNGTLFLRAKAGLVYQKPPEWPLSYFIDSNLAGDKKREFEQDALSYSLGQIFSTDSEKKTISVNDLTGAIEQELARYYFDIVEPNSPPWRALSYSDPERARLMQAIKYAIGPHNPAYSVDVILRDIREVESGNPPTAKLKDIARISRQVVGTAPSSQAIFDQSLKEIVVWLIHHPEYSAKKWGINATPFGGSVKYPNSKSLISGAIKNGIPTKLQFVLDRGEQIEPGQISKSLKIFAEYWQWIADNDLFDHNDIEFLNKLQDNIETAERSSFQPVSPRVSRQSLARTLSKEASEAANIMLTNQLLAVAVRSAWSYQSMGAPPMGAAPVVAEQALRATIPFVLGTDFPSISVTDEAIKLASQQLALVEGKRQEKQYSWAATSWAATQLRPSTSYNGKYVDVFEDQPQLYWSFDQGVDKLLTFSPKLYTVSLPLGIDRYNMLAADYKIPNLANILNYRNSAASNHSDEIAGKLSNIELQVAIMLSASVQSAWHSQSLDTMLFNSLSVSSYRAELAANLHREAETLARVRRGALDIYWQDRVNRKNGFIFVPEPALVENVIATDGKNLTFGEEILVVRPINRNSIVVDVPAAHSASKFIVPGAKLVARAKCEGLPPMPLQMRNAIQSHPYRERLKNSIKKLYERYLERAQITAIVMPLNAYSYSNKLGLTLRIDLQFPNENLVKIGDLADSNELFSIGAALYGSSIESYLSFNHGVLESGQVCDIELLKD